MSSNRSANSGSSNSKRKNILNIKNNNKNSKQKTLGMAWGANNSKSYFQSSPFTDIGSYMVAKNRKLQDQFDAEASNSVNSGSNSGTPIFQGVSIFVDGFTIPSSQELRGYMVKHGGRFENYFSRVRVTHIICSNLPDSKIKNLRAFSRGLPVVKPAWILDSVTSNKLLSWVPYQLDQIASEANNQPKLLDFIASKSSSALSDSASYLSDQPMSEPNDPSLKDGTSKEACETLEDSRAYTGECGEVVYENVTENPMDNASGKNLVETGDVSTVEYNSSGNLEHGIPSQPTRPVSSDNLERSTGSAIVGSANVGSAYKHRSTFADPNFVENYFKSSRLHFIGTWRSRYRKRFPSFKSIASGADASVRRAVIHVDMDCFFVAVVIRNRHDLQDKPVAVCHSDNPRGTAEISSANYPARAYGVRAGMFVRDAKALCPQLVIRPYDFEAYEEVADQFYDILHKHCKRVQAVSCDEAFLDVMDSEVGDPQSLASAIRKEIFEVTRCTASAGVSGNLLMARLATRAAKPNGQYYIAPEKVDDYLHELPIKALPGIGRVLDEKLKRKQVQTCGRLRMLSKESLQRDFGTKTGDMLWNYSRGVDNRLVGVIQESKSVGAEVNWGVRFRDLKECEHFLTKLCKEVSLRLQGCAVQGRNFTLKIKKRRDDAGEPVKYMGCGDCENLSHSVTVPLATDDVEVIQRITKQLFGNFRVDVKDIRGVGLQVSKLESFENTRQGNEKNSIRSWLASASTNYPAKENSRRDCEKQSIDAMPDGTCTGPSYSPGQMGTSSVNAGTPSNQDSAIPAILDLDLGIVESLPPDLFSEINAMYDGKLAYLISKRKGKSVELNESPSSMPQEAIQAASNERKGASLLGQSHKTDLPSQDMVEPLDEAGPSKLVISTSVPCQADLMPLSLSQVDDSVLQQLPEELRLDILATLPNHRLLDSVSDPASGSRKIENLSPKYLDNMTNLENYTSEEGLWVGNPPIWVKMFKDSCCSMLIFLADMYYKSGANRHLSSILQTAISESRVLVNSMDERADDAISCVCDLFKQYMKLTLELDLEEVYVCIQLLKRLSMKSNLFLQVQDIILPHLQASVGECYGGSLCISDGKL